MTIGMIAIFLRRQGKICMTPAGEKGAGSWWAWGQWLSLFSKIDKANNPRKMTYNWKKWDKTGTKPKIEEKTFPCDP